MSLLILGVVPCTVIIGIECGIGSLVLFGNAELCTDLCPIHGSDLCVDGFDNFFFGKGGILGGGGVGGYGRDYLGMDCGDYFLE